MTAPPTPNPTPAIGLDDVDMPSSSYPSLPSIHNVHWHIHTRDCWLLAGQPGSGKSTVLQVAAALLRPARGTVRIFGADPTRLPESELLGFRARIGLVFGHGGRLFSQLTVAENLALPRLYHANRFRPDQPPSLEQLINTLGLAAHAHRLPRELPRVLAQRVALARALVLAPDVLFLDDPVAGLLPEELEWWHAFMATCLGAGFPGMPTPRTFVLATQDPGPWRNLANHVALLEPATGHLLIDPPLIDPVLRPNATA